MASFMQRFIRNEKEPLTIPRWALSLKYFLFVVVGVISFTVGMPVLQLTTFSGYEAIWSGMVALSALIGLAASFHPVTEPVEGYADLFLVAFLIVLVVSTFVREQPSVAMLLVIVTILPSIRAAYIIRRIVRGRKAVGR